MSLPKRIICLCLLVLFLLQFTACSSGDKESQVIKYNIASDPVNLDPPLATDSQSALVVTNLFEGLLRRTADGKLTEGVATDYEVSDDGLSYTFHLRDNAKWSDGTPVTAHDFVFGFQRLFDPSTGASSAKEFYCIQNGQKIHNSELPVDSLGVMASDNRTLTIRLEYVYSSFLVLLTTPPAMPCNEKFFVEAKGRYGLSSETLLSNGAYLLKTWSEGEYLSLRKNKEYHSIDAVKNGGVNLYIKNNEEESLAEFENGDIHAIFVDGEKANTFEGKGYNVDFNSSSTWGLLFNRTDERLVNEHIVKALMYSLDRSSYEEHLPSYLTTAGAVVPPAVTILEKPYRAELAAEVTAPAYQKDKGIELAGAGFSELQVSTLTELTMIVPKDSAHARLIPYISQVWQRDLKIYFKVEELEQDDYEKRLRSGDFDCAVYHLTSSYNSPEAFLSRFTDLDEYGIKIDGLAALLEQASRSSLEQGTEVYKQAEQLILNSGNFLPLYYQTNCFITSNAMTGFIYDMAEQVIDFRNCSFT